ncbi:MAG TPA: AI-2E family transporter [Actinobacteria bacterium]|nr:AI-2E family transporter [Actinomycetota bacterium]
MMRIGSHQVSQRWLRVLVVSWALVGVALLLVAFGWLLGKVAPALVPFLLAIVIVFLFRGPVAALERRGVKRGLAVGICYIVSFAVLGVMLGFLIPALVEQVREFVEAFPGYYERATTLFLDLQDRYQALVMPPWVEDALANLQDTITRQSAEWSSVLAREIFSVGGSAVSLLVTTVLSLVVGFWILKDLPAINREIIMLAGPKGRDEAAVVTRTVSRVLGGYLRGMFTISVVTGVIVTIGLWLIGVPYSLVIGLLATVLNFIPWIGPALTAIIAGIAAAFVSPLHIVGAVAICLGAQQVTEYFVQPRVMSEQVDLHPLLVIFSLLAGATLFGFAGLLLSIPVAAIGKGLFVYYFEKYTDSKLTSEGGALFRASPEAPDDECECDDTPPEDQARPADQGKTHAAGESDRT